MDLTDASVLTAARGVKYSYDGGTWAPFSRKRLVELSVRGYCRERVMRSPFCLVPVTSRYFCTWGRFRARGWRFGETSCWGRSLEPPPRQLLARVCDGGDVASAKAACSLLWGGRSGQQAPSRRHRLGYEVRRCPRQAGLRAERGGLAVHV